MSQPPRAAHATLRHHAAITEVRAALHTRAPDARVFVDFDHTLFLWNSTEAFLNAARPSGLAALMLKCLGALRPWRIAGKRGNFVWRDIIRVMMILVFFPWTRAVFHRGAVQVFADHRNPHLDANLADVGVDRLVIVSFGFEFILRALLRGTRYSQATLIAPRLFEMAQWRRAGKRAFLSNRGFIINPAIDIVITDSATDDADILADAAHACHIEWPDARVFGALEQAYIPFFYTAKIKRSVGFLVKQVFLEEMVVMLITFAVLSNAPTLPTFGCLVLLFIAYMLVYEIGYAENDRVGERVEAAPKLSAAYFRYGRFQLEPDAWIWAGVVSLLAFAIVPPFQREAMLTHAHLAKAVPAGYTIVALASIWMFALLIARAVFWLFNHVPLRWRVFVYLPLHITKYFSPALLLPLHPAGAALSAAQIVRTWAMYAIRRAGGDEHAIPSQLVRLALFALLVPFIYASAVMSLTDTLLLLSALAFCIIRALPELKKKMFPARPAPTRPDQLELPFAG
jgi:hypothetical protein